jgi:16S rRNA (cytosine1402-N4)-methyltransferase
LFHFIRTVSEATIPSPDSSQPATPHRRRVRYSGRNPRRFEEKYKERNPQRYADTVAKVLASGKTPAGTHRPIMVAEILTALAPRPGELAVDCTLGYGGHAQEILARLQPGGRLLGLDADPVELPKTEARLRAAGFGPEMFMAIRSNFAGLPQALALFGARPWSQTQPQQGENDERAAADASHTAALQADCILADLGVSSMQIDDPARGFSVKTDGPLDMRMNPQRGFPASALLEKTSPEALAKLLQENADEPRASELADALAGGKFATTKSLAAAIRTVLPRLHKDDFDLTVRRVFQALRIAVNDEFSALDMLLRHLPACLNPGGRVAILTFHSGEDRRVKKSFAAGLRDGFYAGIAHEVIRPTPEERHDNPRSSPAKLRWARKAGQT